MQRGHPSRDSQEGREGDKDLGGTLHQVLAASKRRSVAIELDLEIFNANPSHAAEDAEYPTRVGCCTSKLYATQTSVLDSRAQANIIPRRVGCRRDRFSDVSCPKLNRKVPPLDWDPMNLWTSAAQWYPARTSIPKLLSNTAAAS